MTDGLNELKSLSKRLFHQKPVDTDYVLGVRHKNFFTVRGYKDELKRALENSWSNAKEQKNRFVIFSRPRTGTTLFTSLINTHDDVHCAGELLNQKVFSPRKFLLNKSNSDPNLVWGCKILSYQLLQIQRVSDVHDFFKFLSAHNFKFIHIDKDNFDQNISLILAQKRNFYHSDQKNNKADLKFCVDIENFLKRLEWGRNLRELEIKTLQYFDTLYLSYENDLSEQSKWKQTCSKVFEFLNVEDLDHVKSILKKVSPKNLEDVILNYKELKTEAKLKGF